MDCPGANVPGTLGGTGASVGYNGEPGVLRDHGGSLIYTKTRSRELQRLPKPSRWFSSIPTFIRKKRSCANSPHKLSRHTSRTRVRGDMKGGSRNRPTASPSYHGRRGATGEKTPTASPGTAGQPHLVTQCHHIGSTPPHTGNRLDSYQCQKGYRLPEPPTLEGRTDVSVCQVVYSSVFFFLSD